jgi:DNA-directed RNA polymerase specialized sigma24 family protein
MIYYERSRYEGITWYEREKHHHLRCLVIAAEAGETVGSWLFRIARNCATDYFRRRKPVVSLECLLPAQHPRIVSLEEVAIAREEERILLAHLCQLSEREREVIGLKFAVGMSNKGK